MDFQTKSTELLLKDILAKQDILPEEIIICELDGFFTCPKVEFRNLQFESFSEREIILVLDILKDRKIPKNDNLESEFANLFDYEIWITNEILNTFSWKKKLYIKESKGIRKRNKKREHYYEFYVKKL
jgi:hypothetical protein